LKISRGGERDFFAKKDQVSSSLAITYLLRK